MSTYEMLEHSPTQAKDEEFVLRDLVRMGLLHSHGGVVSPNATRRRK